jgi:hypothetical protein
MPKNPSNDTHQRVSRQQRNPGHKRTWWLGHYQAWQKSGQSKTNYCDQQGLNLSTFVNWTTRFKREASADSSALTTLPTFFKATPHSKKASSPGLARSLTLRDISVTFEQPIESEALSDWIEVLKRC